MNSKSPCLVLIVWFPASLPNSKGHIKSADWHNLPLIPSFLAACCFAKAVVGVSVSLSCLGHSKYCWHPCEWDLEADSNCLGSSGHPAEHRSARHRFHAHVDAASFGLTQSLFLLHSLSWEETP